MALFAEAQASYQDPEMLFRLTIKDGKLGDLAAERKSLVARENVDGISCLYRLFLSQNYTNIIFNILKGEELVKKMKGKGKQK